MGEILLMGFVIVSLVYTIAFTWAWFDYQEKESEKRRPRKRRK